MTSANGKKSKIAVCASVLFVCWFLTFFFLLLDISDTIIGKKSGPPLAPRMNPDVRLMCVPLCFLSAEF